ncbi:putative transcriptional regulator, PaaX family [Desulfatibacillum aliphaticivorans]|uniref:Transcriptional regulator, PaaX family n=1 Tax=Desulfatibacillum aliphaticivorans TaxID=218208 RepID=B8FMU0_DESAL|nr:PaaX family transcriptional regulator [Desulfatibacillum aliphaticivorans]ACL01957.1 putative transcriptional regulator, PaaX family [Desulfatibacillum aliphaticivorans]
MNWNITPKILIVSILHVSDNKAMPIKDMIAIGRLFGFTGNVIRVTTARLVRDGRLENDERGLYRIKDMDTPISRFVNAWKQGEDRVKNWDGSWICCLAPNGTAGRRKKNAKALELPGFREGLPGLWVRPANLTMDLPSLKELLVHQGMDPAGELFVGRDFSEKTAAQWQKFLWPVEELVRDMEKALERIEKSKARVQGLPPDSALMETYLVGTETVHMLVKDPLLPEEIMPPAHRVKLAGAMLEYNKIGKDVWEREAFGLRFSQSPSHMELEGV